MFAQGEIEVVGDLDPLRGGVAAQPGAPARECILDDIVWASDTDDTSLPESFTWILSSLSFVVPMTPCSRNRTCVASVRRVEARSARLKPPTPWFAPSLSLRCTLNSRLWFALSACSIPIVKADCSLTVSTQSPARLPNSSIATIGFALRRDVPFALKLNDVLPAAIGPRSPNCIVRSSEGDSTACCGCLAFSAAPPNVTLAFPPKLVFGRVTISSCARPASWLSDA